MRERAGLRLLAERAQPRLLAHQQQHQADQHQEARRGHPQQRIEPQGRDEMTRQQRAGNCAQAAARGDQRKEARRLLGPPAEMNANSRVACAAENKSTIKLQNTEIMNRLQTENQM